MLTTEQVTHFRTLGFVMCRSKLTADEASAISRAFDDGMRHARGGAEEPHLEQDANGYGRKSQGVTPFFDYSPDALYALLDDPRIFDVFEQLMGDDFILTVSSGIIHGGGTGWHHDECAPDGIFSMRAHLYLDPLGPADGCLTVFPGSHCRPYRDAILRSMGVRNNPTNHWTQLGVSPALVPGAYPLVTRLGDVLFMNHKLFHAALSDRRGRRAIHINCAQNTTPKRNAEHFEWLNGFLESQSRGHRFYSDRLIRTAGPRRRKMLARALELGYGDTGTINELQDLP